MNNIQNIIVLLWLVPVIGLIVLPLIWSLCGMLYRAVVRSRLHEIQGFVALNNLDAGGRSGVEKRSRPRIHLDEGQAWIDEERDCYTASVADISKQGICLKNVPKRMHLQTRPLRVVFRTHDKDYTVMARPIWKKTTGKEYVIGAEIDRIPEAWKELVTGLNHSFAPNPASTVT